MVNIDKIDDNTWAFNEEGVRFFLLTGEDKALLIDSGMQTHNAKDLAQELTDLPIFLLNTHADPDHIGSNHQFESFYMHPAESANYYNFQKREGEMIPVWDNDEIDLGNRKLKIIEMPGHTPGSIAVLDVDNRRIFSGDPIQDGRIFMFGPNREMNAYRHSLDRLETISDSFDKIYPSHGSYPLSPDFIPELKQKAQEIIDGEQKGQPAEMFGTPIIDYDVEIAHFLCDPKN